MELVLPGAATALCLVLAWRMLARFVRRHRVHELIWGATFSAFGLAAGAETYANLFGWTPALVRLYYLAGASMSVGFLALGALVLLVPRPIALVALGVVLIQSLSMVFFVLRTPVDPELARTLGWEALPKEAPVRALALTINVLGTMVVLLGTFGSAYAQWSRGQGRRALGVFYIGLGTLIVASGASLTRFGHHYLYGPMVLGLLVILAGYVRVTAPAAPLLVTESDRSASPPAVTPESDGTIAAGQLGSSHGTFS